jgi:hypothetical protein
MAEDCDPLRDADRILMAAVDDAIEHAARTAGDHLEGADDTRSRQDYFADGAICFCASALQIPQRRRAAIRRSLGRSSMRGATWRGKAGPQDHAEKKERSEDLDRDRSERRELIRSAQHLAMTLVVQALADQARLFDPQVVERLEAATDARETRLGTVSETDALFTSSAKGYLSLLTRTRERGGGRA